MQSPPEFVMLVYSLTCVSDFSAKDKAPVGTFSKYCIPSVALSNIAHLSVHDLVVCINCQCRGHQAPGSTIVLNLHISSLSLRRGSSQCHGNWRVTLILNCSFISCSQVTQHVLLCEKMFDFLYYMFPVSVFFVCCFLK